MNKEELRNTSVGRWLQGEDNTPLVIRCKDCKHWCNEIDEHTYECCTRAIVNRFKPDDFCSYGERKEE